MIYEKFGKIIETMNAKDYDFKKGYQSTYSNVMNRINGKGFTFKEHLSTLIFAQLSNQRPWKHIEDNRDKLNKIFHDFDINYLKNADPKQLTSEIISLKCGNRQIRKQMENLKVNIETLERIQKDFESIDEYYSSASPYEIINSLSGGKYKIKQMGMPLVSEYLKGVGVDVIKPDVHVCRILGRLGYTKHNPATIEEAYTACENIAKEYGMLNIEVDSILWQFCANGYFEQCTSKPNCSKCLVKDCLS